MKSTCSNCKRAFEPVPRHEPFCPKCVEAGRKCAIDKPKIFAQMGDKGATGDAVEVTEGDWADLASERLLNETDLQWADTTPEQVAQIFREEFTKGISVLIKANEAAHPRDRIH